VVNRKEPEPQFVISAPAPEGNLISVAKMQKKFDFETCKDEQQVDNYFCVETFVPIVSPVVPTAVVLPVVSTSAPLVPAIISAPIKKGIQIDPMRTIYNIRRKQ
jgi:hypothetical protein